MANTDALLNGEERKLIRATQPARLKKLDEEQLLVLHARVRRARNKYSKNYRRGAASRVAKDRTRAYASKAYHRTAQKTEVFETALGRVSDALAAESHRSAKAIKTERLDAASKAKKAAQRKSAEKKRVAAAKKRAAAAKKGKARKGQQGSGKGKGKAPSKTPISKKGRATAKASGKRKQAKRDKR